MSTDDRILDAAMRVFEEVGLRGATTRRIAEEAGVNEVTLFRRFGSKEQLLLAAMRRESERQTPLPERPVEPARELLTWCRAHVERLQRKRLLIRSTLTEVEAHPELCAAAHRRPTEVFAEVSSYLERVRAAGLASGGWDPQLAARMLMGALFSEIVARPVGPEMPSGDPHQITDCFVELFLRAIGAEPLVPTRDASEGTPQ